MELIERYHPNLLDWARNLKVKINMMLLQNMCIIPGSQWCALEMEALREVQSNKSFYVSATLRDSQWYRIISYHLYFPYKLVEQCVRALR